MGIIAEKGSQSGATSIKEIIIAFIIAAVIVHFAGKKTKLTP